MLAARWAGGLICRPATRPPLAPPCRRCRLPLPSHVTVAAAAAGTALADSDFARLVKAGGAPKKTAVGKLPVAELRAECKRLGLPADGLKAVLVERLLMWWAEQAEQQEEVQQESVAAPAAQPTVQQPASGGSSVAEASAAQVATPAAATASTSAAFTAAVAPAASSSSSGAGAPQPQQPPVQRQGVPMPAERVRVTWLGTSSGSPTPRRNVSCIAVRYDEEVFLVDCGEGTRNQLRKGKLDPARVRVVFVTHMHGDHCFGIGGLIAAVCEARLGTPLQHEPLHIYGPPELQSLVAFALRSGSVSLTTPVVVTGWVLDPRRSRPPTPVEGSGGQLSFGLQGPDQGDKVPPKLAAVLQAAYDQGSEDIVQTGLTWSVRVPGGPLVCAAQLQHRVPCWGYVFQEPSVAVAPPQQQAAALGEGEAGEAAATEGAVPAQQQQAWARRGRKLVILGDTCDSRAIAPLAMGCDLLSHEATFCMGMEDKAEIAQHSTTEQAGAFAAAVAAQNLVLTHFSARYESITAAASHLKRSRRESAGSPRMSKSEATAEVMSQDAMRSEMQRLRRETLRTYRRENLYLANDFYTFEVAAPAPMPAEQLRAQQAQQAQRAAEGGPMPEQRQPRQQPRHYGQQQRGNPRWPSQQDRRGGGGGGQRQRQDGGRWQQQPARQQERPRSQARP